MISRLPPPVVSFVVVLCGYILYVLIAVPWIEPRVHLALQKSRLAAEPVEPSVAPYRDLLTRCFPAGHWALNNPKVLESPHVMLLLQDWRAHDNGRVELTPCAILFFPEPRHDDGPSHRAPIILEAPQGAQLQFDSTFDLAHGQIGKLLHGELAGPITIHSDMDQPSPRDDLLITTRDVQLNKSRIWTEADVDLQLGAHRGHGRQMEIRLLPAAAGTSRRSAGIDVGGIQWLELKEHVRVELHPEDRTAIGMMQGTAQHTPQATATMAAGPDPPTAKQPPVRVTCKGPFHFDLIRRAATFEEQVDVHRLRIDAASDTLSCSLLTLQFATESQADGSENDSDSDLPPTAVSAPAGAKGQAFRLRKIIAEGAPVKVNSPATGGLVRCPKLEYMPSDAPGKLPEIEATGPGNLVGVVNNNLRQTFRVAWSQRMAVRNHQGQPVVSIWGKATVSMLGAGTLSGDQIHVYLKSDPNPDSTARPGQPNVLPDRMVAISQPEGARNVRIASQPLTGAVDKLEVWFVKPAAPAGSASTVVAADAAGPVLVPAAKDPAKPKRQQLPRATYDIRGRLLQVELVMAKQLDVTNLTVSGAVRFHETKTAKPGDIPLQVAGSWLRVIKANSPAAEVTVRGQPASIAARGLAIQGDEVQIHRGENRLWIDSPGQLSLPISRGMMTPLGARQTGPSTPIRPVVDRSPSDSLRVSWQGRMNFDGQRASFHRSVMAWDETGWLKTESLVVTLSRPIDFNQSRDTSKVDVAELVCQGGVTLQNQTLDNTALMALDKMKAQDLTINHTTGAIHAKGPGWVSSIRIGSANPIMAPAGSAPPSPATTDPQRLQYLEVGFDRTAEGNLNQRSLTFFGDVRGVHGPVDRWDARIDPNSVDAPSPGQVRLTSHSLTVTQTGLGNGPRGTLEIEARGNAMAEGNESGQRFTARAEKMSFIQAKEQLILEGTGRTDAQLWRQTRPGSAPEESAARKILYWLRTQQVRVDDFKSLNLSDTPQPAAGRPAAAIRGRTVPR